MRCLIGTDSQNTGSAIARQSEFICNTELVATERILCGTVLKVQNASKNI